MTEYSCGCVNSIDEPSGILRNVRKCDHHRRLMRDPARLSEAYYKELLDLDGDTNHLADIAEALGEFPIPAPSMLRASECLEIGCGCSPYAGALSLVGWDYLGLDASRWATAWTAKRWRVRTVMSEWERFQTGPRYGLILAAHVLEHLADAPAGLQKMAGMIRSGGELWIVVPDDTDPVNPDHIWFFTQRTLERAVQNAGFVIERLASRKIVERENFLYLRATKP